MDFSKTSITLEIRQKIGDKNALLTVPAIYDKLFFSKHELSPPIVLIPLQVLSYLFGLP